jgi:hypothetical protein
MLCRCALARLISDPMSAGQPLELRGGGGGGEGGRGRGGEGEFTRRTGTVAFLVAWMMISKVSIRPRPQG